MAYLMCEWRSCIRFAEVTCFCAPPHGNSYCCFCLMKHLRAVGSSGHSVLPLKPAHDLPADAARRENEILPLDLFMQRLRLRFKYMDKMLQRGLTLEQLLLMDMKDIHFLCRALGMSDTEKYLIWDELFYIKAVTGQIKVKQDAFLQLVQELNAPQETTLNAHLVPRRGEENKFAGLVKSEVVKKEAKGSPKDEEKPQKVLFEEAEENEELFQALWSVANH
mmetsp:Transcript_19588/g.35950  ORF Transcript_19588/g.35950 Transcript_19588/m.35950 type:complete len:221 (-) Transcript_19588:1374-2036(-)